MSLPFLSIRYDEDGDPNGTYEGVVLRMGHGEEVFNTGSPTVDYLTAHLVVQKRVKDAGGDPDAVPVMGSSSIDHFIMDGGTLRDGDPEEPTEEELGLAITAAKAHLGLTPGSVA